MVHTKPTESSLDYPVTRKNVVLGCNDVSDY